MKEGKEKKWRNKTKKKKERVTGGGVRRLKNPERNRKKKNTNRNERRKSRKLKETVDEEGRRGE